MEQAQFRVDQNDAVLVARLDDRLVADRSERRRHESHAALPVRQRNGIRNTTTQRCQESNKKKGTIAVPGGRGRRCPGMGRRRPN